MCQKWFAQFKSDDFNMEVGKHAERLKKLKVEELEALLVEDYFQTHNSSCGSHEPIIFHPDNACAHVARRVKNYLENSGWEVLPHPPYSSQLAPSNYHMFRSMRNALTGIRFISSVYQEPAWFMLDLHAGAVILAWNPQIARKMEKCYSFRWAIFWII